MHIILACFQLDPAQNTAKMPKARILILAVHSGREGERGKADHSAAIDEIDEIMSDR